MSRAFAKDFYHSKAWKDTREAYFNAQHGLCERCARAGKLTRGEIVHHIQHLSPQNIDDPRITLNFNNLMLVCRDCHALEHGEIYEAKQKARPARVAFDVDGNVVQLPPKQGAKHGE